MRKLAAPLGHVQQAGVSDVDTDTQVQHSKLRAAGSHMREPSISEQIAASHYKLTQTRTTRRQGRVSEPPAIRTVKRLQLRAVRQHTRHPGIHNTSAAT